LHVQTQRCISSFGEWLALFGAFLAQNCDSEERRALLTDMYPKRSVRAQCHGGYLSLSSRSWLTHAPDQRRQSRRHCPNPLPGILIWAVQIVTHTKTWKHTRTQRDTELTGLSRIIWDWLIFLWDDHHSHSRPRGHRASLYLDILRGWGGRLHF